MQGSALRGSMALRGYTPTSVGCAATGQRPALSAYGSLVASEAAMCCNIVLLDDLSTHRSEQQLEIFERTPHA